MAPGAWDWRLRSLESESPGPSRFAWMGTRDRRNEEAFLLREERTIFTIIPRPDPRAVLAANQKLSKINEGVYRCRPRIVVTAKERREKHLCSSR